jgi:peptidase M16-like protein
MTSRTLRFLPLLALLATALPARAAAPPRTETLSDSTVVESWTLGNGLRVLTRHVPDASAVAITVGYSIGIDDDPEDRQGLAQLMAELVFTSAAGDIPERSREELDSVRPLGWSFPVSRHSTLFTEIASADRFPGVLNQVAIRMRGVQVTQPRLDEGLKNARYTIGQQLFSPDPSALYFQVREIGAGRTDEEILKRAAGRGLEKLTLADVRQRIQQQYVPANAVLSLAGDLRKVDVHALVQNLFGDIPAGQPMVHPSRPAPRAASRLLRLAGISAPEGVVGIIAPALTDSMHPSFYLNALLLGSHFNHLWLRDDEGHVPNRYHYAVFDEPDLMRIFPPASKSDPDADVMGSRVEQALNAFSALIVTTEPYEEVRSGVLWMLGAAMPAALASRAPHEPALLHTMSRTMAARALWGGEEFWADYRRRFQDEKPGHLGTWLAYFKDPKNQVRLLALPRK